VKWREASTSAFISRLLKGTIERRDTDRVDAEGIVGAKGIGALKDRGRQPAKREGAAGARGPKVTPKIIEIIPCAIVPPCLLDDLAAFRAL